MRDVSEVASCYRIVGVGLEEDSVGTRSPGEGEGLIGENSRSRLDGVLQRKERYRSKAVERRGVFRLVDLVALTESDDLVVDRLTRSR